MWGQMELGTILLELHRAKDGGSTNISPSTLLGQQCGCQGSGRGISPQGMIPRSFLLSSFCLFRGFVP